MRHKTIAAAAAQAAEEAFAHCDAFRIEAEKAKDTKSGQAELARQAHKLFACLAKAAGDGPLFSRHVGDYWHEHGRSHVLETGLHLLHRLPDRLTFEETEAATEALMRLTSDPPLSPGDTFKSVHRREQARREAIATAAAFSVRLDDLYWQLRAEVMADEGTHDPDSDFAP